MITNINNKIIVKATSIEHTESMSYLEHLKEYTHIIADYIDVLPHSCIIGNLLNLQQLGKKVTVLLKKDCIIKDLFSSFDCEFI